MVCPAPFEIFGEYILLKRLAAGMAEVFVARPARWQANGRVVVLKRILREAVTDENFIQMFQSEIRVTLGFNHPNLIQLHDFGEIDGQPYLVMEFIEGRSLRQIGNALLRDEQQIHPATVLELLAQAAAGLGHAHDFENPITGEHVHAIHRDVSPQNLIVSYDGHLKVIDFGIAKAKNSVTEKTRAGTVKGKCAYLSPEQLHGLELDGRSDLFSLAAVGWELLTGQRLFQKPGDTDVAIMQRVLNCETVVEAPSKLNSKVPHEVDQALLKALRFSRDDRYKNAGEFEAAIRKVLRRLYPGYTNGHTAQLLRTLFEQERQQDRKMLFEANLAAQNELEAKLDGPTHPSLAVIPVTGFAEVSPPPPPAIAPMEQSAAMEAKLARIEGILHQRAKTWHIALATFYVLTIIGLKIDDKYSLFDRFVQAKPTEITAHTPVVASPAPRERRVTSRVPRETTRSRAPASTRPSARPKSR